MGKLEEMINSVERQNETEKEIGEQLKILLSQGEKKVQIFRQEIETSLRKGKTTDDLEVPIAKVLGISEEYRAYTERTQDELQKNVTESVAGMLSGCEAQIVNGVAALLTNELGVI